MVSISNEIIEELKCATCKKYLSYSPVYEHKETGTAVCGRCWTPDHEDEDKYHRNALYEKLSKHIKFPCQYKDKGCEEILCPSEQEDCVWKDCYFQLLDHYKEFHKELLIENNKVELDFSQDFNTKYLLINNNNKEPCEDKLFDGLFIVHMIFENGRFNGAVYYFGPRRRNILNFTLVLNSIDSNFPEVVPLCLSNYNDRNDEIVPSVTIISKTRCVIGTFNISRSYSIIKRSTLSCFFCSKYKGDVIVSCKKGHNVCEKCTTKHSDKCDFTDLSINEKLIETFLEPEFNCKNRKQGCTFVCEKEKILQTHQNIYCAFKDNIRNFSCSKCKSPFSDYKSLLDHSIRNCLNIVDDNSVMQWDFTQTVNNIHSTKTYKIYDNRIFMANFAFISSTDIFFMCVRLLHNDRTITSLYNYEIHFVKPNTNTSFLVARECPDGRNHWFNRQTVESAIHNGVLYYKIKIVKK